MKRTILTAVLCCTTATATAAPKCDASLARGYTEETINAGATCWSFLTRFGPEHWSSDACTEMGRAATNMTRAIKALDSAGCTSWTNGPTRQNLDYINWLHKDLKRLQGMQWDDRRGWVYHE